MFAVHARTQFNLMLIYNNDCELSIEIKFEDSLINRMLHNVIVCESKTYVSLQ